MQDLITEKRLLIWLVIDQHIVESTQNIRALSSYFVYACCCLGTCPSITITYCHRPLDFCHFSYHKNELDRYF